MTQARRQSSDEVLPLQPVPVPEPPVCPDGWHTGPPDFVGVGAQRSGTTWWYRLIIAHPEVCFKRGLHRKEIHFFDELGDRGELSREDVERYHRHFPRPDGQLVGEWTPRYMHDPWAPKQVAQAAPEARVLMLLRDPVDRFASGFARGRRLAAEQGVTGLDARIAEVQVERGMYFAQVLRVLEAFDRARVLVLQYERCRERTDAELRRTFEFLALDPDLASPDEIPAREPRERELPAAERERLATLYAPDVRRLVELLPELDVSLWRSVSEVA